MAWRVARRMAWMCMDVHGCAWMSMDVHGCAWMCMDVHGCAWHGAWHGMCMPWSTACACAWCAGAAPLSSHCPFSPSPCCGGASPISTRKVASQHSDVRVALYPPSSAAATGQSTVRSTRAIMAPKPDGEIHILPWMSPSAASYLGGGGNQRAVARKRAAMLRASSGRVHVRVRGSHPAEISSRSGANAARIGSTWRETRWRGGVRASNAAMGRGAERWH